MMSESNMNGNVASENSAARERGASVAREYERVVSTFNKVLLLKEKVRLSVEYRISELESSLVRNEGQLDILSRNLKIYELNISKIADNLEELLSEETSIKEKYNNLLQGASMDTIGVTAVDSESVEEKSGQASGSSTENLIQQRYHFLDNLNFSFQKLDNDCNQSAHFKQKCSMRDPKFLRKRNRHLRRKSS